MVITKNSNVAKIFREILKDVLTPRAIGEVSYVSFVSGKGYIVKFDNSALGTLYIKDPSVDFTKSVNGSIVSVVAASLETADEVAVALKNSSVSVGAYDVGFMEGLTNFDITPIERPTISFTAEQYAKLEKDFDLTEANYFSSQKNVDTIGFVSDEGAVKEIATGASLYKITNEIDATVDTVLAEQTLGHATRIYLIPRRIYNFTKHFEENLKIYLSADSDVYFESDVISINYSTISFGTNQYKLNKNMVSVEDDGIEISTFKDIVVNSVDPLLKNKYGSSEDQNIEISATEGKMVVTIGNNVTLKADSDANFKIGANAEVISYLCHNYPECKIKEVGDEGSFLQVKNGNDYLIFQNNKF